CRAELRGVTSAVAITVLPCAPSPGCHPFIGTGRRSGRRDLIRVRLFYAERVGMCGICAGRRFIVSRDDRLSLFRLFEEFLYSIQLVVQTLFLLPPVAGVVPPTRLDFLKVF